MEIYIVQSLSGCGELELITTDYDKAKEKKSEEFPDTFCIWEFDTETQETKKIDD